MKSIEHYKKLDDDGKMDFLDNFDGNSSVEFLNYLEEELFSINVDEFVKVEILKCTVSIKTASKPTTSTAIKSASQEK